MSITFLDMMYVLIIYKFVIYYRFKVYEWTNSKIYGGLPQVMVSPEYDVGACMESLFVFLATLIGVRTNLCKYLLLYLITIHFKQ